MYYPAWTYCIADTNIEGMYCEPQHGTLLLALDSLALVGWGQNVS